ncbi:MULE domain-containing protein [Aphis craccivora]|uniref:MULE domain-containing protein n=1 Tax=Aphis craccivora TaxID=307492 RepID=A0A6G0YXU2_APHCR|nr:MULE domain-containing protein [Aphis craccivora]
MEFSISFKFRFQKLLRNDIQQQSKEHNHPKPEQQLLNRQNISNSLKKKAKDDISSKPSKLLQFGQ